MRHTNQFSSLGSADLDSSDGRRSPSATEVGMKHANYHIIVTDKVTGQTFTPYTAEDLDEAEGYAAFCRAEMRGTRVTIERIEWMEDEDR